MKLADLDEAIERAAAVVAEKNPSLDSATRYDVARAVGIGAVKYADLSSDRVKDYVFDWDRMLAFEGNTAPYLQYAHARIHSIFRRAAEEGSPAVTLPAAPVVAEPAERDLALALLGFEAAVEATAEHLQPHRLCTYLFELASTFTTFYESCPVLRAGDASVRGSRLLLCDLTARTLRSGLSLLGIEASDRTSRPLSRFFVPKATFRAHVRDKERCGSAPQEARHPLEELERIERLGEVVVGARGRAGLEVGLLGLGRQQDDRDRPGVIVRLQRAGDLQPVHLRHHHVEHDGVGVVGPSFLQALETVAGGDDRVALHLEVDLEELQDDRVVVRQRTVGHAILKTARLGCPRAAYNVDWVPRPRSSGDRASASGAGCVGSNPTGGANNMGNAAAGWRGPVLPGWAVGGDRREGGKDGVDGVIGDADADGGVVVLLVVTHFEAERFEEGSEDGLGDGGEVDVEDG